MEYSLELEKAVTEIRKNKAKLVCIQLPDGLKLKAKEIKEHLEENTDTEIIIWLGSCYGGCDIPNLDNLKVDMLIQWGHSEFVKNF